MVQFGFGIQPLYESCSCLEVPKYHITFNCLDFCKNVFCNIYFSLCCLYAQRWVIQELREVDYCISPLLQATGKKGYIILVTGKKTYVCLAEGL